VIRAACVFALLVAAFPADACSRKGGPPTLAESIAAAQNIFVARLVSAKEKSFRADGEVEPYVEGRYRLLETLKGLPSRTGVVHDLPLGPGNCSLGLLVGWDYVFMTSPDKEYPRMRWVGFFSGSFPLGPYREPGEADEKELQEVREILKSQSEAESP